MLREKVEKCGLGNGYLDQIWPPLFFTTQLTNLTNTYNLSTTSLRFSDPNTKSKLVNDSIYMYKKRRSYVIC